MAMTTDIIVNAMKANYNGTPSADQIAQMTTLAQAIIDTIKTAQILYTSGLTSPSGAVTGVFGNTIS